MLGIVKLRRYLVGILGVIRIVWILILVFFKKLGFGRKKDELELFFC